MKKDPWSARKNLFSTPSPISTDKRKVKFKWGKILGLAIRKTCTLIGGVVLFSALLTMCAISPAVQQQQTALPHEMVLVMKLDGQLGDLPIDEGLAGAFRDNPKTLRTYIDAIYSAKNDPRVKGIYAQYLGGYYSLTAAQELRAALADFRESGKFTYVYSSSYSSGLGGYYLLSAFDEIWMQPMGNLVMSGVSAEIPFFRDLLDKVGIEPNFYQRKEYKSAYESFTNSDISPANKESMTVLIDDLTDTLSTELSADLGISKDEFKKHVDHGLFLAEEAKQAGLIDVLGYESDLKSVIEQRVNAPKFKDYQGYVNFDKYHDYVLKKPKRRSGFNTKPHIALIYVNGAIVTEGDGAGDGYAVGGEIAEALLDAASDSAIEAVVLRVDSPGGSPVASETILHATQMVKDAGKPVIVSMGSAAASGGYWVSAYADYIFASPMTMTGSIGVLGGKVSARELWDKIGVNWERIEWGKNASMWSMNTPFSKGEAERINAMLDHIYDEFITRVASGRDMTPEEVDKIARGRVWSGKSALEIGLIDQFGGLNDAFDYAAVQVGRGNRSDIEVQVMPKPLSPVEKLVELLEGQVRAGEIIGMQAELISYMRPLLSQVNVVRQATAQGGAVYEPFQVK